jgi:hypothetical protein
VPLSLDERLTQRTGSPCDAKGAKALIKSWGEGCDVVGKSVDLLKREPYSSGSIS